MPGWPDGVVFDSFGDDHARHAIPKVTLSAWVHTPPSEERTPGALLTADVFIGFKQDGESLAAVRTCLSCA